MTRTALRAIAIGLSLLALPLAAWSGPIEGRGRILGKDVEQNQIQIDDTVYQLTPLTKMRWADGKRATLQSLVTPPIGGPPSPAVLMTADFEGHSGAGAPVLDVLVVEPSFD